MRCLSRRCTSGSRFIRLRKLQRPEFDRLKDYIFDTYIYIDNTLDQTRSLVARNRFCEIRYEDLVRDPVEQLRAIYERLEMGEFEKVLPALERHLAGAAAYQTNRYECSPQLHAEITRRWGRILPQIWISVRESEAIVVSVLFSAKKELTPIIPGGRSTWPGWHRGPRAPWWAASSR